MRMPASLLLVLAVAACGGNGPTAAPSTAQPTVASTVEATVAPTLAATPTAAPGIGELYVDPEGEYQIRVDPEWEIDEGTISEGIEFWFLGPPEDGLSPNLNVLVQRTGRMTLEEYTQASIDSAPTLMSDFEMISTEQITVDGVDLAIMEYTGTTSGNFLHFLAVFTVTEGRALVATLTAPPASFASWRAIVEPYMRTLRGT